MNAFAEDFAHEDYFMQLARKNGLEVVVIDPTPAVGNFLKFATQLTGAKSVVEIGTNSGVGGLWVLQGLPSDVADFNHTADKYDFSAGSVTAALFLEKFVGDRKWVHFDIAGPGQLS